MHLFCGRLNPADDKRLVEVMENAVFGGAAFPHEHEKVAVCADRRDRSVPEVAGVVDALAPMADERFGTFEIGQSGSILRSDDDQEPLSRKSHERLRRQRMPFKGHEPHRKCSPLGPVDRKYGLAIGRFVVESSVGVEAQRPPIINQAAAFRVEGQHLAEWAEG